MPSSRITSKNLLCPQCNRYRFNYWAESFLTTSQRPSPKLRKRCWSFKQKLTVPFGIPVCPWISLRRKGPLRRSNSCTSSFLDWGCRPGCRLCGAVCVVAGGTNGVSVRVPRPLFAVPPASSTCFISSKACNCCRSDWILLSIRAMALIAPSSMLIDPSSNVHNFCLDAITVYGSRDGLSSSN